MNKKAIVFAVAVAALTSGAAFAQSYEYRNDRNDGYQRGVQQQYQRADEDHRYGRDYRSDGRVSEHRSYGERDGYRYGRRDRSERYDGYNRNGRHDRHDRYEHRPTQVYGYSAYNSYGNTPYQMRRGERLASHYRDDRYVVSDWRGHHLHQPQRGYHWVQAGSDYALVAIATGLIAQVLLNH